MRLRAARAPRRCEARCSCTRRTGSAPPPPSHPERQPGRPARGACGRGPLRRLSPLCTCSTPPAARTSCFSLQCHRGLKLAKTMASFCWCRPPPPSWQPHTPRPQTCLPTARPVERSGPGPPACSVRCRSGVRPRRCYRCCQFCRVCFQPACRIDRRRPCCRGSPRPCTRTRSPRHRCCRRRPCLDCQVCQSMRPQTYSHRCSTRRRSKS
mmetsp:Transcript_17072/g.55686  ORF Transcript_17072/g.55686 Transcript_17072/m.55686 type:complete len:210 (+) Transcript_17072:588-1217(+)